VWAPNIPGWENYPLTEELRVAIGDRRIKVAVGSDRAACILGEASQGAAHGCRDAIFIAVGTGIGAGILVDGRVLEGAHGIAGAIGWWALNPEFRDEYRQWGCFESHASGAGIARLWNTRKQGKEKTSSAAELFKAYEGRDPVASDVLHEAIQYWGMATANLISVFNPERIIFGGGVFGPATRFLSAIADQAARWAQPVAFKRVTIEASQLGGDAALYGAAALARSGRF
jgi:glucokinase